MNGGRGWVPGHARGFLAWLVLWLLVAPAGADVVFEGDFESRILQARRMVRICTPPGYSPKGSRRYPVLYVQDGQNAFTTAGTNAAFGWGNWALDRTSAELIRARRMEPVILVAIDATRDRYLEYRGPARKWTAEELAAERRPPPAPGDDSRYRAYQSFLVEELKPWVDREYRTRPGPADTALLGSSLGGLVSLALAWERPDVFGAAASLSGAFQVEGREFLDRVKRHTGGPKPLRLYLDSGITDFGGGDDNWSKTQALVSMLRDIGWRDGRDLVHGVELPLDLAELERAGLRADKRAEALRSQHNEFYWRQRAHRALEFLFPAQRAVGP